MTDRYHSLTVVLERDIRTDDVEPILLAIRMIRGVAAVSGEVADSASHMAEKRALRALADKLWAVLEDNS